VPAHVWHLLRTGIFGDGGLYMDSSIFDLTLGRLDKLVRELHTVYTTAIQISFATLPCYFSIEAKEYVVNDDHIGTRLGVVATDVGVVQGANSLLVERWWGNAVLFPFIGQRFLNFI